MSTLEWLKGETLEICRMEYLGEKYFYRLINGKQVPELPYVTGMPDGDTELLFISEEVPEKWRRPILIHEIECCHLHKRKKGRCVAAVKKELECVPKDELWRYVGERIIFFRDFVEFNRANGDSQGIQKEIEASLKYLECYHKDNFSERKKSA